MKPARVGFILFLIAALGFSGAASALDYTVVEPDDRPLTYLLVSGTFSDKTENGVLEDVKSLDANIEPLLKSDRPLAIFLTSHGGTLDSTQPLARRIDYWSKLYFAKTKKPLIVALMLECSSACTFFSAELTKATEGKRLVMLAPSNTVMRMHGPIDEDTGLDMQRSEDFEKFLAQGMKAYESSGVSKAWLQKHKSVFRSSRGKAFKAGELCRDKSGFLPANACVANHEAVLKKIAELTK